MATTKTSVNPEFLYIPIGSIVVLEQVRSNINTESDSFKSLVQSIKDKGILEPLLVTKGDGDSYTLICGERRLEAARQLGHESVPVRIIEAGKESGETIALQLTENLQREDLNPMDQAKGILSFIQAKHPDKGYDMDGVMSELVSYNRRPEDLPEEIAVTVTAIVEISGKSIKTLFNGLSLLKLSDEIQTA
ncbi:MAG: ParB/RepB/Spo0J family partition protein, partial [Proteobacteria bacterium]|nr:ParB/RepB/Spo0J family partition protein [Pseudomonadota bacterium]